MSDQKARPRALRKTRGAAAGPQPATASQAGARPSATCTRWRKGQGALEKGRGGLGAAAGHGKGIQGARLAGRPPPLYAPRAWGLRSIEVVPGRSEVRHAHRTHIHTSFQIQNVLFSSRAQAPPTRQSEGGSAAKDLHGAGPPSRPQERMRLSAHREGRLEARFYPTLLSGQIKIPLNSKSLRAGKQTLPSAECASHNS